MAGIRAADLLRERRGELLPLHRDETARVLEFPRDAEERRAGIIDKRAILYYHL